MNEWTNERRENQIPMSCHAKSRVNKKKSTSKGKNKFPEEQILLLLFFSSSLLEYLLHPFFFETEKALFDHFNTEILISNGILHLTQNRGSCKT